MSNQPLVGIWWYTDNHEVWAHTIPRVSGTFIAPYIQFDKYSNHKNLWADTVRNHMDAESASERIDKGYKSFERGRVVYNYDTRRYEVACSGDIWLNTAFRQAIIHHFNLEGHWVEFMQNRGYHKVELTHDSEKDKDYYFDSD